MDAHCWICGGIANSREHGFKRSDISHYFGPIGTQRPLYKHTDGERPNNVIITPTSDKLMSEAPICQQCNNERTQPYDNAWETLSHYLQDSWASIVTRGHFSFADVFSQKTRLYALYVHLYFVKAFGCKIKEEKVPVNLGGFAQALLSGKPHKHVFLTFANMPKLEVPEDKLGLNSLVERENLYCGVDLSHTAAWVYGWYPMSVRAAYLSATSSRAWRFRAWHPSHASTQVRLGKYVVEFL